MKQTILGAGGSIGIELAKSLTSYTADIRLVNRNPVKVNPSDTLFPADLTKKDEVSEAVKGSDIVYVTIGFPYKVKVWEQVWMPFIQNVVDACMKYEARLVFFDNVYAIGANHIHHITETSEMSPTSKKGEIRKKIDELILDTIQKNKIEAIIARAPDFFGGTARENSLLINLVYNNLVKGKKAQWLSNAKVVHSIGYVPDLAKGTALLGNTPEAYNQIWNLPTDPERITGEEWIRLFASRLNATDNYTVLPNWLIKSLGLFIPFMKELAEMNYQYERDYYFDSTKFNTFFNYKPTPHADAVSLAVEQLAIINNKTDEQ